MSKCHSGFCDQEEAAADGGHQSLLQVDQCSQYPTSNIGEADRTCESFHLGGYSIPIWPPVFFQGDTFVVTKDTAILVHTLADVCTVIVDSADTVAENTGEPELRESTFQFAKSVSSYFLSPSLSFCSHGLLWYQLKQVKKERDNLLQLEVWLFSSLVCWEKPKSDIEKNVNDPTLKTRLIASTSTISKKIVSLAMANENILFNKVTDAAKECGYYSSVLMTSIDMHYREVSVLLKFIAYWLITPLALLEVLQDVWRGLCEACQSSAGDIQDY